MPLTSEELQAFHRFATVIVGQGRASSLEDCVRMWNDDRDFAETVAAIKEAEEESAAGLARPLDELEAELRAAFGMRPRQPAK